MNREQTLATRDAHHPTAFPALCLTMLLALALAGCSGELLPRPDAPSAIYLLEGNSDAAARPNPAGPTLAVSAVRSAAGFGTADMIYVEHAHQLQAFARHRWADSPARMLDPLLVAAAEQSGLFAGVTEPGSLIRTELRLETELLRLQQVFDGGASQVELTLRASLVDTSRSRVLASRVFRVIEPVREATPYGGVLAANRATGLLLGELQVFLGRALTQR